MALGLRTPPLAVDEDTPSTSPLFAASSLWFCLAGQLVFAILSTMLAPMIQPHYSAPPFSLSTYGLASIPLVEGVASITAASLCGAIVYCFGASATTVLAALVGCGGLFLLGRPLPSAVPLQPLHPLHPLHPLPSGAVTPVTSLLSTAPSCCIVRYPRYVRPLHRPIVLPQ